MNIRKRTSFIKAYKAKPAFSHFVSFLVRQQIRCLALDSAVYLNSCLTLKKPFETINQAPSNGFILFDSLVSLFLPFFYIYIFILVYTKFKSLYFQRIYPIYTQYQNDTKNLPIFSSYIVENVPGMETVWKRLIPFSTLPDNTFVIFQERRYGSFIFTHTAEYVDT